MSDKNCQCCGQPVHEKDAVAIVLEAVAWVKGTIERRRVLAEQITALTDGGDTDGWRAMRADLPGVHRTFPAIPGVRPAVSVSIVDYSQGNVLAEARVAQDSDIPGFRDGISHALPRSLPVPVAIRTMLEWVEALPAWAKERHIARLFRCSCGKVYEADNFGGDRLARNCRQREHAEETVAPARSTESGGTTAGSTPT
jgi:hypothetical protein